MYTDPDDYRDFDAEDLDSAQRDAEETDEMHNEANEAWLKATDPVTRTGIASENAESSEHPTKPRPRARDE